MRDPADTRTALEAALPVLLRPHAAGLAALLADPDPARVAALLAARPVLAAALAALAGQSLAIEGGRLQFIAGDVGTLQQITISGGYVDKIIGTAITVQLPPAPRHVDPAAAQELLAAMPLDALPPAAPLPEIQRMPLARNPLFVGRAGELRALAAALRGAGGAMAIGPSVAATGLGGIGKTNLASEFVHRYGPFFAGGVFWISLADPAAVAAEVAACGEALGLPGLAELKLDDQVARVRVAWAQPTPRLLIFDNCEDEALLQRWRPTSGGCRVLVTSRRGQWSASLGVAALALGVLSRAESVALLRKHRPDLAEDDVSLHEIAAELGDLPLALHLAGSYLETYRDSAAFGDPAAFLVELRDAKLLDHDAMVGVDVTLSPTNHELHVAKTFALSYGRLDAENAGDAKALALLARAAHLAPGEPIPRELLLATLDLLEGDKAALLAAERGLLRLGALGLLERAEGGALRMHRLVGSYVRQASGDAGAQAAAERVIMARAEVLTNAPTNVLIAAFLPILRSITDIALLRENAEAATLCIWLGRHLDYLGSYTLAQSYVERALALRERLLGAEHPDTTLSLNNLAYLYETQGNYDDAYPLYERALAINEHTLGPEHPQIALSLNNLANFFRVQGNYDAARPLFERALAMRERMLGPEHPDIAQSLNNLAGLFDDEGNYEAAYLLTERALAMRERMLGPEHPDIAQSLNNLAGFLRENQENYEAARLLYERALAINERVFGPEHPQNALSISNLADLLENQENYEAARPLYERALAINERVLGPEHPQTVLSLSNLADLLENQENYEAARPLYERALAINERAFGPEHLQTASSLDSLAVNLAYQNQLATAADLMSRALTIREKQLGSKHPKTQESQQSLVNIEQELIRTSIPPTSAEV